MNMCIQLKSTKLLKLLRLHTSLNTLNYNALKTVEHNIYNTFQFKKLQVDIL